MQGRAGVFDRNGPVTSSVDHRSRSVGASDQHEANGDSSLQQYGMGCCSVYMSAMDFPVELLVGRGVPCKEL